MTLLTAFLENEDFRKVTLDLPGLLSLIFDKNLYKLPGDDPKHEDFLTRLVRYESGHDAPGATACNMLDRFTTDMWSIAQPGGLTMANNDLTKTLIAFAMQMYYENPKSTEIDKYLFTKVAGGDPF
jgi:hypothetical protein